MEKAYQGIKGILLSELPEVLSGLESEDIRLTVPNESDIVYGPVDVSRHEGKVVFAIVPMEMAEAGGRDCEDKSDKTLVLSVIIRGHPSGRMYRMIDRYTHAVRLILRRTNNISVGRTQYMLEAGATVGTMTAAETYLTVKDDEPTYGDPFADDEL